MKDRFEETPDGDLVYVSPDGGDGDDLFRIDVTPWVARWMAAAEGHGGAPIDAVLDDADRAALYIGAHALAAMVVVLEDDAGDGDAALAAEFRQAVRTQMELLRQVGLPAAFEEAMKV